MRLEDIKRKDIKGKECIYCGLPIERPKSAVLTCDDDGGNVKIYHARCFMKWVREDD